jgi:hypothetical protein
MVTQKGLLAEQFPSRVALASLGKSYEGRNIHAVTLVPSKKDQHRRLGRVGQRSGHRDNQKDKLSSVFVDCGFHAREWLSPAFCLYLLDRYCLRNLVMKKMLLLI